MNKLTKNFLLLVVFATYTTTQPASASDDEIECLFTPNAGFCLESSQPRQAWADVDADLDTAATVATELLLDEVISQAAVEIVTQHTTNQASLAKLDQALTALESDIKNREDEINGSRDIFRTEIYTALNLTGNNILLYLTPQIRSILLSQEKIESVLRLIESYHTGSLALEKDFATKGHRSENSKKKFRNKLTDLQRLEYTITGISNDAISAYRRQGGVFKREQ